MQLGWEVFGLDSEFSFKLIMSYVKKLNREENSMLSLCKKSNWVGRVASQSKSNDKCLSTVAFMMDTECHGAEVGGFNYEYLCEKIQSQLNFLAAF
jgi:hypothetical protein